MSEENEIVFFKGDDPAMLEAAQRAQESFRWFWYQVSGDFNRIVPATSFSIIKAAFSNDFNNPDETVEHMFVDDIRYDGREIKGVLRSSPNWVQSLNDGDEVTLPLDRLGDWICVVGDVVYGGFAVQVIRAKMSAKERAAHDEAWGLPFPDIGTIHIPERSLEFEEMITGHLKNALAEDPKIVATIDANDRTPLHNEALFGRLETTKALLEHGADANAKCDHGWTALDYANALGWSKVAEVLTSKQLNNNTKHANRRRCANRILDHSGAVLIMGCDDGIDFAIAHSDGTVTITANNGDQFPVSFEAYSAAVYGFSKAVRAFYDSSAPKVHSDDYDRQGFENFVSEWERRHPREAAG